MPWKAMHQANFQCCSLVMKKSKRIPPSLQTAGNKQENQACRRWEFEVSRNRNCSCLPLLSSVNLWPNTGTESQNQ
uniref:Uncharacterized protein n=1 Tax=Setaria viridis TaxID=4556 RepID=A0A4V6D335_SETVI|nr:hypothetical protein SEVIR_8G152900v2 [Setaria viridis]